MTTIVIDYGAGNILSVANALEELGEPMRLAAEPAALDGASRIILPGVGAMGPAMRQLRQSGLADALDRAVRQDRVPFLGICLGMQMMCRLGHEGEVTEGLGWIDGEIRPLSPAPAWPVPHMGWAEVVDRAGVPVFDGLRANAAFYFCHSYYADAAPADQAGRVEFAGTPVTAALWRGNAIGVQFHPERSGNSGLRLIENFLTWDGGGRNW